MLFDTHAHYDDVRFNEDRYELLKLMPENNVGLIMNACTNLDDIKLIEDMTERFDFVYGSVGFYPHETDKMTDRDLDIMKSICIKNKKIRAIGEIGLDYYYDGTPKNIQKERFAQQIELASELDLPVIIHDRDAHGDIIDILKAHKNILKGGVFHCYSGSVEMAKTVLDLGMYIAFGGSLTFKNAKQPVENAAFVPSDRILLETDSPYLAPVPMRGKRNTSILMKYVAEKMAQIRNTDVSEIERITFENGKRCFGI